MPHCHDALLSRAELLYYVNKRELRTLDSVLRL